jgi:hypothetical protein
MKKILLINILCFQIMLCQEKHIDCATTILIKQSIQNFKILKYPDKYYIRKVQNFKEIRNNSPETLMASVLSANNLEWYNFNKEKKVEKTNPALRSVLMKTTVPHSKKCSHKKLRKCLRLCAIFLMLL